MFTKMWKDNVSVASFKFNYSTREDFTTCYWQKGKNPTAVWLAYRIVLGLYFIASFVYVLCFSILGPGDESDKYKFFIFLTNWTYTVETFSFCMAGVLTVLAFRQNKKEERKEEKNELSWCYKIYWISYTIALTVSVLVTSLFWIKVYDPVTHPMSDRSLILHAFNCIFMVIDFALVAHPIRFLHFYCPVLYSLAYLIFSVIYEFSGGTGIRGIIPIYKILDWKEDPKQATMTSLMALSVILTVHVLFYLLSTAKMRIRKKYNAESSEKDKSLA